MDHYLQVLLNINVVTIWKHLKLQCETLFAFLKKCSLSCSAVTKLIFVKTSKTSTEILAQGAVREWGWYRASMWLDKGSYHFPANSFISFCFPDQSSWGQLVPQHDSTWGWNNDQMYQSLWQSKSVLSLTSWQNGAAIDNSRTLPPDSAKIYQVWKISNVGPLITLCHTDELEMALVLEADSHFALTFNY